MAREIVLPWISKVMVQLPSKTFKSTAQLTTVFSANCKKIYREKSCHCCFCSRILEDYICIYNTSIPCYNKRKFSNFKSFCFHLEKAHKKFVLKRLKGIPVFPGKASKKAHFFCRKIERSSWKPCFKK